ncbi:hypothetical protein Efla_006482 [Eimeria flavescens]
MQQQTRRSLWFDLFSSSLLTPNSPNAGLVAACSPFLRLPSPQPLLGHPCLTERDFTPPAAGYRPSTGESLLLSCLSPPLVRCALQQQPAACWVLDLPQGSRKQLKSAALDCRFRCLLSRLFSYLLSCLPCFQEEERKKRGQKKKEMAFIPSSKFEEGSYQPELSATDPGAAKETVAGSLSLGGGYGDSVLSHSASGVLDEEEVEQSKEGALSPGTEGASVDEGGLQLRGRGPLGGRGARPELVVFSLAGLALAAVLLLGGRRLIAAAVQEKYPPLLVGQRWVVEKFPVDGDEGRKQLAKEISRFAAAWDGSSERVQSAFLKHYSPAGQFCKASSSALSSLRLQAAKIGKNRPAADASPEQKQRDAVEVQLLAGLLHAATERLQGLAAIESHVEETKCGAVVLDIPPGEGPPLTEAESKDLVTVADIAAMMHPETQTERSDGREKLPRVVAMRVAAKLWVQELQLAADRHVRLAVHNALYQFVHDWLSCSTTQAGVDSGEEGDTAEFALRWMDVLADVERMGALAASHLSELTKEPFRIAPFLQAGEYEKVTSILEVQERKLLEKPTEMKEKNLKQFRLEEVEGQEPFNLDELFAAGVSFV